MKIQIKSIAGSVLFEGDFSCIAEAVKAALKSYANLSYADLRYADLRNADLSYADLSYADLRYANLSYADLSNADLRYANLSYADLRYANLRYADLRNADLSYADLRNADLSYADLSYADLRYADLRYADLSNADLSYVMNVLPVLENPDAKIAALIKDGKGELQMDSWHKCETIHCRAGWYVHMSGPAGAMLEACYGPSVAGALIFTKAYPDQKVPNFHASNEEALADIESNAERATLAEGSK